MKKKFRLMRYTRTWYHSTQHDNLCVFLILVVLCYVLIHISTDTSTLSTASGTFQNRFATGTAQSVTSHLTVTSHYFQQRFWSNIHATLHGHQFTLYCFPAKILWMQIYVDQSLIPPSIFAPEGAHGGYGTWQLMMSEEGIPTALKRVRV